MEHAEASVSRHRDLGPVWMTIVVAASTLSVLASIYFIFNVHLMIDVKIFGEETEYYYFMLAMLLPLVFLLYPPWRNVGPMDRVPWYDILLSLVVFAVSITFAAHGEENLLEGWEYAAPEWAVYASYFMWLMVLEATRRAGGMPIFVICFIVSLYPALAEHAPGFLEGQSETLEVTASFHMFGTESVMGIPMRAFASLVVGFLIFGVALQFTGGGAFFLNLAFALLGRFRGGPAKVAIFSSGLMGSMSGSVITNVLTTGALSIPAMKRVGFRPAYAGGVEACASTGGVLMPPVMGATAFIMATFLEISYAVILVAAIIPSLLYYFSLFMQIDAYSARFGLEGLPKAEMPKAREVMRDGWHFIFVLALLIVMLLVMQQEAQAPYYAAALLIVINQVRAHDRWNLERCKQFLIGIAKLFTELAGILAGVGLIIGALMLTGKVGNLSLELVTLAGDSIFVLLVMGAITSFILGMGMTVTAAYLFLAIALAPALTASGAARPARRASLHDVLGHDLLHHAAGGPRRLRRRHGGPRQPHHHRLRSDAARRDHLFRAVLLRAEPGADRPWHDRRGHHGLRAGLRGRHPDFGRAARLSDRHRLAHRQPACRMADTPGAVLLRPVAGFARRRTHRLFARAIADRGGCAGGSRGSGRLVHEPAGDGTDGLRAAGAAAVLIRRPPRGRR